MLCTLSISGADELVQMAILLDTSGSMDGLIDQAKAQLWKIVNELALAKKNGKSVSLEVGLYEYGNDGIPATEGHLRMIVNLTKDLDKISEELFKLTTNGGSEYCGQVIDAATGTLNWSKSNNDLKIIYIAGNEPFTQGSLDYKSACSNAIKKGIIVNTIFCGDYKEGISTFWKHGADLADGKYINIDQNQKTVHIDTPYDEEIVKLGNELNKTYLAYGSLGTTNKSRQEKQDLNASTMSEEALVQRSISKAQSQYVNSSWDLLDAVENGMINLEEMEDEELPEELKGKSDKEIEEYIKNMQKEREKIQKEINELNEKRRKYVAKEMEKIASEDTLDSAIIKSVREQATKKHFAFE